MNTRAAALLDLLALTEPYAQPVASISFYCSWLPAGRKPWPRGDALKRDLATAYAAWRRMEHVGEFETAPPRTVRVWRRA